MLCAALLLGKRAIPILSSWRGASPTSQVLRAFGAKKKSSKTPIVIDERDLEEKFVKGGGSGGQKINKTSSKVQLLHVPTGILIQCQDQRDLHRNRKIARQLLKDKLDVMVNGDDSKIGRRITRIRRRKSKRSQRARDKYGTVDGSGEGDEEEEEEEELIARPVLGGQPCAESYNKR